MMILAETTSWQEFGLAGLVIGALFSLVVYMFKMHSTERTEWRKDHKAERDDWKQTSDKQHTNVVKVLEQLEQTIREQKK